MCLREICDRTVSMSAGPTKSNASFLNRTLNPVNIDPKGPFFESL